MTLERMTGGRPSELQNLEGPAMEAGRKALDGAVKVLAAAGIPVGVSSRDVVAACLPDPAGLGDRMHGRTCAGLWVTGTGSDGAAREVYLYHVVDNEWSMAEYGSQCVVWQTAVNPVIALELLAWPRRK